MSSKRILIVCNSFYPKISPRALRAMELSKEFARHGYSVVVALPGEDCQYKDFEQETGIRIKVFGPLYFRNFLNAGNKKSSKFKRFLSRTFKILFEWPEMEIMFRVASFLRNESGYDLLISVAVPHQVHWGVAKAVSSGNRISKVWVADCGDPYMGDRMDSFRKMFYFRYFEKWFCRKADYITIPFEEARAAYYKQFQNKIRIIPQGFRLESMNLPVYTKSKEYPVFAYAGSFIKGKRDPGDFFDFLSRTEGYYKFHVYTSQINFVVPYISKLGDRLEIHNLVPREQLLIKLAEMDFLVNFDNNVTTQRPSKLIDYAITGRPVLNILENDNFGNLREFMHENYSNRMILEIPENFDIVKVASSFISLLS
jgi:hypothetical protein